MLLGEIVTKRQIIPDLKAVDRWEAIDELIDHLVACEKIRPESRDAIAAVVKERETSMSTGIGFGVGIPHASTDLVGEAIGAFGRSVRGIHFDALDNKPVNLVILFLVPEGQSKKHLLTLANIAKCLKKAELRKSLCEAKSIAEIQEIICAK